MSNRTTTWSRFFIPCTIVMWCSVAAGGTDMRLNERLATAIRHPALSPAQTGVAVIIMDAAHSVHGVNPDLLLNPASCAKIVTTATALSLLGPDYRFTTQFFADRQPVDGAIRTLFIKGDGDPTLVEENVWKMIGNVAESGVRRIEGDIIIDNSFFDGPNYPKKDVDHGRAFTAPTSAFAVNFNSTILSQTVNDGDIHPTYRSTTDPVSHASAILKEILRQRQIVFSGTIRAGLVPQNAVLLLREPSKPLTLIVRDMNKFSNNFIAEQLLKHLGARQRGAPGSTAKGVGILEEYLESLGVRRGSYVLENGSGFSEKTRLSARALVTVLAASYRNFAISADMVTSFSLLGVDGTMKKWQDEEMLRGQLRGKTGSLAGVVTLAGYVPTANDKIAAFAILANGVKGGLREVQRAEMEIVKMIAQYGL